MRTLLTQIHKSSKYRPQGKGHNDVGIASFSVVNHEQRYRRNDGDRKLMSPPNIKDIIQKSEHSCYKKR